MGGGEEVEDGLKEVLERWTLCIAPARVASSFAEAPGGFRVNWRWRGLLKRFVEVLFVGRKRSPA